MARPMPSARRCQLLKTASGKSRKFGSGLRTLLLRWEKSSEGASSDCSEGCSDEDLGARLLRLLACRDSFDSYKLSQELRVDHQQVVGAIKSVQSVGDVSRGQCNDDPLPTLLCS